MIKEHLWEFLERQGFKRGAVETYGENRALRYFDSNPRIPRLAAL